VGHGVSTPSTSSRANRNPDLRQRVFLELHLPYLHVAKRPARRSVVVPDDITTATARSIRLPSTGPSTRRTSLVSISHVPTQGVLVQPAEGRRQIRTMRACSLPARCIPIFGQLPVQCRRSSGRLLSMTGSANTLRGPLGHRLPLYAQRATTGPGSEPSLPRQSPAKCTDDERLHPTRATRAASRTGALFRRVNRPEVAADQPTSSAWRRSGRGCASWRTACGCWLRP